MPRVLETFPPRSSEEWAKGIKNDQHVEEALRQSEERFRLLVEGVKDYAIFMLCPDGRIASWNAGAERIKGYRAEEIIGRHFSCFYTPEDLQQGKPERELRLAAADGRYQEEGWRVRKDGTQFWADVLITALRDRAGKLIGFAKVTRDTTERKQAEEALARQAANLRAHAEIFDLAHDAIIVCDLENAIIFWNQGAVEMYGWAEEEAVGKLNYALLQTEFPKPLPAIQEDLLRQGRWEGVLVHTRRDGTRVVVSSRWALKRDDQGKPAGILKINTDITEQRRTEERIRQLNDELQERILQTEEANRELEAFSYSVSHDLRAPLRAMVGFSRILLEEHAPQLGEEVRHYLTLVRENAQQMGRLIDALLNFSRLGRQPLVKERVAPAELVRRVLEELGADRRGQLAIRLDELPVCQADPVLLKQVFTNLLANALKYTGQRDEAVIQIGSQDDTDRPGQCLYFVKDNGVGFDMRYVHKLFGVFQRLHRAEDYEGTGVGLATVQRIVNRHGGRVWAEAEPDRGATFYFTLPGNADSSLEEKEGGHA
jgi:PAS domain S-box-containing protein